MPQRLSPLVRRSSGLGQRLVEQRLDQRHPVLGLLGVQTVVHPLNRLDRVVGARSEQLVDAPSPPVAHRQVAAPGLGEGVHVLVGRGDVALRWVEHGRVGLDRQLPLPVEVGIPPGHGQQAADLLGAFRATSALVVADVALGVRAHPVLAAEVDGGEVRQDLLHAGRGEQRSAVIQRVRTVSAAEAERHRQVVAVLVGNTVEDAVLVLVEAHHRGWPFLSLIVSSRTVKSGHWSPRR